MIGGLTDEGFIMLDDKPPHGNLSLVGSKPEFDGIWMVDYNDTVNPVINEVELTPPDYTANGKRPDREWKLSDAEIIWWKDWVQSEYDKITAEKDAKIAADQRVADEELVAEFGVWGDNNKITRDNLLGLSDAYETFDHLKTDEWVAWRQWLRDLPEGGDPLTAVFIDPPSNANQMLKRSYDNWKQRLTITKEVKEKL